MPAPNLAGLRRPWAALLLTVCTASALAGCAAAPPAGGEASTPTRAMDGGAPVSPSALAVRGFVQLCASLRGEAVAQQARAYAFVPLEAAPRTEPLLAELRAKGMRGWIRPVPGGPALLTWSEQGRVCELAVGGIDPGEVERVFAAMAGRLERNGLAVTHVSPRPEAAAGPLRLRQAVVVSPRGLVPDQPRALALRTNADPAQSLPVVLTMRPFALPAAPGPQPEDDAIPAE